jgi:methyltransferase (TIGR00027 family)
VEVDFSRDDLDACLTGSGHDPASPTFWILEGVVPYLTMPQLEATLAVVARRSAPGSRLAIAYVTRSRARWLGLLLARLARRSGLDVLEHEPQVTFLDVDEMRALLARHGMRVQADEDVVSVASRIGAEIGRSARFARAGRIVIATR